MIDRHPQIEACNIGRPLSKVKTVSTKPNSYYTGVYGAAELSEPIILPKLLSQRTCPLSPTMRARSTLKPRISAPRLWPLRTIRRRPSQAPSPSAYQICVGSGLFARAPACRSRAHRRSQPGRNAGNAGRRPRANSEQCRSVRCSTSSAGSVRRRESAP